MDLSQDPTVVKLQNLLQSDLVENMENIEAAAQGAVSALSKHDGSFNSVMFDRNILLVTVPSTIPLYSWMLDSEPALFLQNALKGDIRLVLIAAFAGSPIGYPLLALRRAIQTKYNLEATQVNPGDLLAMIHGFDDQVNIIDNLYMDVSNVPQDDELRPLIAKMFPQVEEDAPDFKRNNIDWTASTNIIPIPSGGGGGKGGGVRGGRGGGGGNGGGGGIPEDPKEPTELIESKESKESKEPNEDSNSFMFVIILLLLCVAAFALIKGNGR